MTSEHSSISGVSGLPKAEFAFPGPLRDKLVTAILDGTKTATTGLVAELEREGEPLPVAGDRSVVVDSHDRPVAVIEVTDVRVVPLKDVPPAHARDEGEGHAGVADWRADHEEFWQSEEMRAALDDPDFTVDDTTEVVLECFQVVRAIRRSTA